MKDPDTKPSLTARGRTIYIEQPGEKQPNTHEWQPSRNMVIFMNIAGLALIFIAFIAHFVLWAVMNNVNEFSLGGSELLWSLLLTVLITFVMIIVHELLHGLIIKIYGGSPKFGTILIGKVLPAFYCTAPGKLFTKKQFLIVALAPFFILGILNAVVVAFIAGGGWFVLPAAIHLGGCIGDLVLAFVAARQIKTTLIEDMKSGMRFVIPET